ncbi:MAG: FAD-binding protein, partial [Syntrophales bacterium]|nr:FAD-binding protein [Syntrophales bacterium]
MEIETDFLVLGSGIAGLGFALKASRLGTVAIVTKKETVESSTNYAQGGIASVTAETDSFDSHVKDTLYCGAGLCHENVVRFVVSEGPSRIGELIEWGVRFSMTRSPTEKESYDLGREGGHSHRRVLHAEDLTGREIERALVDRAEAIGNIRIFENHFAINLITLSKVTGKSQLKDRCIGAYVYDVKCQEIHTFRARFIILATGGSGKVYLITTNPDIATGDGLAMAFRAGAVVANMEFVQFHPTCLYHPAAKSFLISEAVRGEGGVLILKNGASFMEHYHPMKSLAPRDVVAQAIDGELKKSGDECVYLDISHRGRDFLISRFPHIYRRCMDFGIDMAKDP